MSNRDAKTVVGPHVGTPVERRTLLRWFGNATVLALGGNTLAACLGGSLADSAPAGDASIPNGDAAFPFAPGEGKGGVYERWWEIAVETQDLADILATWSLTIDGLVRRPRTYSFQEILDLPRHNQVSNFQCVVGWVVEDVPWNGVLLSRVLDLAGVDAKATHLTFHCQGGTYKESLPLAVAREPATLLAYGVDGNTLPLGHGFPLRLVVPRLFGYKNAKHVTRIEVTDREEQGYWEEFGYPIDGVIPIIPESE